MKRLIAVLVLLLWAGSSAAVQPGEMLAAPAAEARARQLSRDIRCLVCQNQSIDDSEADLARDLRGIVRERLKAGDSDDAVIRYVVERYGDFVLLRPPFKTTTVLLWIGPPVILALGFGILVLALRRRRVPADETPLTTAERQRLAALGEDPPS